MDEFGTSDGDGLDTVKCPDRFVVRWLVGWLVGGEMAGRSLDSSKMCSHPFFWGEELYHAGYH